jgi:hypothetical protein
MGDSELDRKEKELSEGLLNDPDTKDIFNEVFGEGWEPETIEDGGDFKNLSGAYLCRVEMIQRRQGTSQRTGEPYDFYSIKLQVVETLEGDKGDNRYVDINFTNDAKGLKRFADSLFTGGLEFDKSSPDAFDTSLVRNIDKTVNVRMWTRKGNDGKEYWNKKIIKTPKLKNKSEGKGDSKQMKFDF